MNRMATLLEAGAGQYRGDIDSEWVLGHHLQKNRISVRRCRRIMSQALSLVGCLEVGFGHLLDLVLLCVVRGTTVGDWPWGQAKLTALSFCVVHFSLCSPFSSVVRLLHRFYAIFLLCAFMLRFALLAWSCSLVYTCPLYLRPICCPGSSCDYVS